MKFKILSLIFLLSVNSLLANVSSDTKIIFRFDDYLLTPSKLTDSLFLTFSRNKIPLCIGIIPFDTSGKFLNQLDSVQIADLQSRISNGEIEVALHGYNHRNQVTRLFFRKSTKSEFATTAYEKQLFKLSAGKRVLDSLLKTNISVFVPPFNTYDNNTLKALEKLNFKIISGNRQGPSDNSSMYYMPETHEDFSGLAEIIKKNKGRDVTIVVYFHPYTFVGGTGYYEGHSAGTITINQLDGFLKWVNTLNISSTTFTGLAKEADYGKTHYNENTFRNNLLKKALNYLKLYSYGVYFGFGLQKGNSFLAAANILLHIVTFVIVFLVIWLFYKKFRPAKVASLIILLVCLVPVLIFLIYIRNDYSFGIISIMLAVILCAVISGMMVAYRSQAEEVSGKGGNN